MATDCPVCLATARGGRIRLTEPGADVLEELLRLRRHALIVDRRRFIEKGNAAATGDVNERIRTVDVLLEEIARTQDEMRQEGWRNGQHERADA